ISEISYVNATVYNKGLMDEVDVTVDFKINNSTMDTVIIPSLSSGNSMDISFNWVPPSENSFLVELDVHTVPDETFGLNNHFEQNVTAMYFSVHNLNSGIDYPTIQSAIDTAGPGDEIFVESGTYSEQIVINTSLKLIGEGMESTFIMGGLYDSIFVDNVMWVDIEGFTILNTSISYYGILSFASMLNVTDCRLMGNDLAILGDQCYSPYKTSNLKVENCTISNNRFGIELVNNINSRIVNCSIVNNTFGGIILSESFNNYVINSIINSNNIGINQYLSDNNFIENNTLSLNNDHGIYLLYSNNNSYMNNHVKHNDCGSYLVGSYGNDFANNILSYNEYGIYVSNIASAGTKNSFYHNDFIDNVVQAYDPNANIWDRGYPSGGNYWSDYAGADLYSGPGQDLSGNDGIGDIPYVFDNQTDSYPLTEPSEYLRVEIPLSQGWNLISIPIRAFSFSLEHLLESISGKWDRIYVYDTTDTDPWKSFNVNGPESFNEIEGIDHKTGFWINITEADVTLVVDGMRLNTSSIPLYAGWNLVGYPTLNDSMNVANALWGTGADRVEVFDPASPYLIKEAEPDYLMQPGEGCWVHVIVDTVWTIDW
ncbi:MAG: right-handed parallel beta-helix repeat-containing protein, partial [Thermoplasmata archaeon]|nr:right-handed parallel beta-helix repeat-containing protein [Thermoplasmata archaeon]